MPALRRPLPGRNRVPANPPSSRALPATITSGTPAATACSAVSTFMAMPPEIAPSATWRRTSAAPSDATVVPPRRTPSTSERYTSAEARSATASARAASSALTLRAPPSAALRDGRDDRHEARRPGRLEDAHVHRFRASRRGRAPAARARAAGRRRGRRGRRAGSPAAVSPAARPLLTTPESTISTTSIASGEVSRRPPTKRDSRPRAWSARSTWRPPPCTTSTRPRARRSSSASAGSRPGSSSAGPPSLYTKVAVMRGRG